MAEILPGERQQAEHDSLYRDSSDPSKAIRRTAARLLDEAGDAFATDNALPVKVIGADLAGVETFPFDVDAAGNGKVNLITSTIVGAVTETAPGSDTASSGLNGRLQRIAQRLTSIIALLPSVIGQRTKADSLSTVIASDQMVSTTPLISDPAFPVRIIPWQPATYAASGLGFVPPAAATDIAILSGSGSKTIRVTRVRVSGSTTSGSAIKVSFNLVKRSTAASGGTSTTPLVAPYDSTNAAGTAVLRVYTANPTVGTSAGVVRATSTSVAQAGVSGGDIVWALDSLVNQPVILRGTAEALAINLNGATVSGPIFSASFEWEEV